MTGSRLRNAARDLRAAGVRELAAHAWRAASIAIGRHRRRFPPGRLGDQAVRRALGGHAAAQSPERWRQHLLERRSPRFFFHPSDRTARAPVLRARGARVLARAEAVCGGAVTLFGRTIRPGRPLDWHTDPFSGHRWPDDVHWSSLGPAGPIGADARAVWELNRLRDLFVLGRAYWRTGDERFARVASERLRSWIDANPPELGINWWSNLEVAVRSIACAWALHLFLDAPAFDAALVWDLTGLLVASGRHVARDLDHSRRCMPGNHVIGDAAGLAVTALVLPEISEAPAWTARATALLEDEVARQVRSDGTHAEESPAYQAFVWELLFTAAALARQNGVDMPRTWSALERMAAALALQARPDGSLPGCGDSDDGVGYDLDDEMGRAFAIASLAATAFSQDDLARVSVDPAEASVWFFGPDAASRRSTDRNGPLPPLTVSSHFGLSARSSWRRDADYCFLRCGQALSKHTHADALHLELVVGGSPLLRDAGTGTYNADPRWRAFFRSTRAHNTVVVDGRDQAEMHRSFRWVTPLPARSLGARTSDGLLVLDAEHDGYARLGVRHRRQVIWLGEWGWLVVDRVTGRGSHEVELRWLTDGRVSERDGCVWISTDAGAPVALGIAPLPSRLAVVRGRREPQDGWVSDHYGEWHDATTVVAHFATTLPLGIVTFVCKAADERRAPGLAVDARPDGLAIAVTVGGETREFATVGDVPWRELTWA